MGVDVLPCRGIVSAEEEKIMFTGNLLGYYLTTDNSDSHIEIIWVRCDAIPVRGFAVTRRAWRHWSSCFMG